MSYNKRNKLKHLQKANQKIAILILSFILPIASIGASLFITRANDEQVIPSKSGANSSTSPAVWTQIVKHVSQPVGQSNGSSQMVTLYDDFVYLVWNDQNIQIGGKDGKYPAIKITAYNLSQNALNPDPSKPQSHPFFAAGRITDASPYEGKFLPIYKHKGGHLYEKIGVRQDSSMTIAVGSYPGGGFSMFYPDTTPVFYPVQVGEPVQSQFAPCNWGWDECKWNGTKFYGYYSSTLDPSYTDSPKIIYSQDTQMKGTKPWDISGKPNVTGYNQWRRNYKELNGVKYERLDDGTIVYDGANNIREVWVPARKNDNAGTNLLIMKLHNEWNIDDMMGNETIVRPLKPIYGSQKVIASDIIQSPYHPVVYVFARELKQGVILSDDVQTEGRLYTYDYRTKQPIGSPVNLSNLSTLSQPGNPVIVNKKIFFTSTAGGANQNTDTVKGIYSCNIDELTYLPKDCKIDQVPSSLGDPSKIMVTGLTTAQGRIFASVDNPNDGSTYMFEFTPSTGDEDPPLPTKPTPTQDIPETTPETDICSERVRATDANFSRIFECEIDMQTGFINENTCQYKGTFNPFGSNPQINLYGMDFKHPVDNEILFSYITDYGQDLSAGSDGLDRCYGKYSFNEETGDIGIIPNNKVQCKPIANTRDRQCNEEFKSYSSYEFKIDETEYTVMTYMTPSGDAVVGQICPYNPRYDASVENPNSSAPSDRFVDYYSRCIVGTVPISGLRNPNVGGEVYKSYSSFMLNEKRLIQYYLGSDNKLYQNTCDISYSYPPNTKPSDPEKGARAISLIADRCEPIKEVNISSNQDGNVTNLLTDKTIYVASMEPFNIENGKGKVRLYSLDDSITE